MEEKLGFVEIWRSKSSGTRRLELSASGRLPEHVTALKWHLWLSLSSRMAERLSSPKHDHFE